MNEFIDLTTPQKFHDFKIICSDGVMLYTSKFLLYHQSDYFKRMLDPSTEAFQESKTNEMMCPYSSVIMNKVLNYIILKRNFNCDIALLPELVDCANQYLLEDLKKHIDNTFSRLPLEKVKPYFLIIIRYNLEQSYKKFILENISIVEELFLNDELDLTVDEFKTIIINSNNLSLFLDKYLEFIVSYIAKWPDRKDIYIKLVELVSSYNNNRVTLNTLKLFRNILKAISDPEEHIKVTNIMLSFIK